jgi:uncharacterized protein with HEPN domain
MQRKTPKLLTDISDSASFILECARGRTIDDYRNNRQMRQAVERNFEIIGEAVNRLSRLDPDTTARISDISRIVSFRNVLIHGYDLVDDAQVWAVISSSLPVLLREVSAILTETDEKAP